MLCLRHGASGFTFLRRQVCCGFFRAKKSIASAGFAPANLESNAKHANHYTTETMAVSMNLAAAGVIVKKCTRHSSRCVKRDTNYSLIAKKHYNYENFRFENSLTNTANAPFTIAKHASLVDTGKLPWEANIVQGWTLGSHHKGRTSHKSGY
jgi:hypothetical protein